MCDREGILTLSGNKIRLKYALSITPSDEHPSILFQA